MRTSELFDGDWFFLPEALPAREAWAAAEARGTPVTLPHTWNAIDGQDGGNDYRRGPGTYVKRFAARPSPDRETWLELRGANSTAVVHLNGVELGRHAGGYSTFRVEATPALAADNVLVVVVDNGPDPTVYPQWADFTFYGGLYRDVHLLTVPEAHFALDDRGGPGVQVTPTVEGDDARLALAARVTGGRAVRFTIEGVGSWTVPVAGGRAQAEVVIGGVHLWQGLRDPHLYTLRAELLEDAGDTGDTDEGGVPEPLDTVSLRFGCRTTAIDPDRGFLLNGEPYALRGVSRHQDWAGVGNAVTRQMMDTDLELITELGATAVRLAHYQHDQYFYDLCDAAGIVVWAEIPQISGHVPEASANAAEQLAELVVQNRHHPSIACWGLSNEITVSGAGEQVVADHRELQALAHDLDPTRPTAMAHFFLLETDHPLVALPEAIGYNLYYGWYVGELEDNDRWLAEFHAAHPDLPIALTEYGADANPAFQTCDPQVGDYSEQYQALYHEHMVEMIERYDWLWATFVWNLADFGADGRDEGGIAGRNSKGLVTFDRQVRKDAFHLYRAAWSPEPFVHVCGRRYVHRPEAVTGVTVYSNCERVELWCDGALVAERTGRRVFRFEVPLTGSHTITARATDDRGVPVSDTIRIARVAEPDPDYAMARASVTNWVDRADLPCPAGFYSINDTLGDIGRSPEGGEVIRRLMEQTTAARGEVAARVEMTPAMVRMIERQTVASLLRQAGEAVAAEQILELNRTLNRIPK